VDGDFGVSIDEAIVKVGETEEGLYILDFPGFGPILMIWTLYGAMVRAFR